jgi:hypothetical protein
MTLLRRLIARQKFRLADFELVPFEFDRPPAPQAIDAAEELRQALAHLRRSIG